MAPPESQPGLVSVVEIDGLRVDVTAAHLTPDARLPPAAGRRWWLPAGGPSRRLAVFAAALALVALGSVVAVTGARHHRHLVVHTTVVDEFAAGDALGCPVDARCAQRTARDVEGILADYGFTERTETEVYDVADPTLVYGRLVSGTRGPDTVTVWSRCAWTSPTSTLQVSAMTRGVAVRTTVQRVMRGLEVFLRETNSVVVQFATGCTMSVRSVQTNPLYVNTHARSYVATVRELSTDLRLQP